MIMNLEQFQVSSGRRYSLKEKNRQLTNNLQPHLLGKQRPLLASMGTCTHMVSFSWTYA